MKTNAVFLIIFVMAWLILSGCKQTRVCWEEVKIVSTLLPYIAENQTDSTLIIIAFGWYIENPKTKLSYDYSISLNGREYIYGKQSVRKSKREKIFFSDSIVYPFSNSLLGKPITLVITVEAPDGQIYESNPMILSISCNSNDNGVEI